MVQSKTDPNIPLSIRPRAWGQRCIWCREGKLFCHRSPPHRYYHQQPHPHHVDKSSSARMKNVVVLGSVGALRKGIRLFFCLFNVFPRYWSWLLQAGTFGEPHLGRKIRPLREKNNLLSTLCTGPDWSNKNRSNKKGPIQGKVQTFNTTPCWMWSTM